MPVPKPTSNNELLARAAIAIAQNKLRQKYLIRELHKLEPHLQQSFSEGQRCLLLYEVPFLVFLPDGCLFFLGPHSLREEALTLRGAQKWKPAPQIPSVPYWIKLPNYTDQEWIYLAEKAAKGIQRLTEPPSSLECRCK